MRFVFLWLTLWSAASSASNFNHHVYSCTLIKSEDQESWFLSASLSAEKSQLPPFVTYEKSFETFGRLPFGSSAGHCTGIFTSRDQISLFISRADGKDLGLGAPVACSFSGESVEIQFFSKDWAGDEDHLSHHSIAPLPDGTGLESFVVVGTSLNPPTEETCIKIFEEEQGGRVLPPALARDPRLVYQSRSASTP